MNTLICHTQTQTLSVSHHQLLLAGVKTTTIIFNSKVELLN